MKSIIFIFAIFFFISECNADFRVLQQLRSQSTQKAKKSAIKNKKPKKTVKHKKTVLKEKKQKEIVTSEELDFRDGLAYLPNKDKPFTGKHEAHHSNGKKYSEIKYKNGKRNGRFIMWDEYGHKIGELDFEDGNQL